MTYHWKNTGFQKSCLASVVSLLITQSGYALESLSDDRLAETTGEGIALLPENFKMVFQGPNDLSTASSYNRAGIIDPSKYDTGFIRIIPTGENYQQLYTNTYNKYYAVDSAQQYQTSYDLVYQSSYNQQYGAIKDTEYNKAYAQVKAQKEQTYRDYEFSAAGDSLYTERYNFYLNGKYKWPNEFFWLPAQREAASKADALNDLNNVKTYKDQITARVENKLKNDATPIAQAQTENLAKQYALNQVDTHVKNAIDAQVKLSTVQEIKNKRTKADAFIYGLALSNSKDKDGKSSLATRYSNVGFNWGDAANPWLFRAGTAKNIKQFASDNTSRDISYLALEAPLASVRADESDNNIKLGFWMDIFSRAFDSSSAVNPITGAPTSGLDLDQRLRLQYVANGLSMNGSQVRLFQTLPSTNPQYNQTLGMANILRLNTNDNPANLKKSDTDLDSKAVRISTAARSDQDDGTAVTPAIDRSFAPIFNDIDGIYLYSPNFNLVLGNMYQPFVLGSEGNNIILEVTRIPNVPEIYSQIYTYYSDTDKDTKFTDNLTATSFKGSTCNVAYCGSNLSEVKAGSTTVQYQGTNATHSSISVGSVTRDPTSNLLKANTDANATGVVFKSPTGTSVNLGSAAIDGVLIQHLKFKTTGL